MNKWYSFFIIILLYFILGCGDSDSDEEEVYHPIASPTLSPLEIPALFEDKIIPPQIPSNNPQTREGATLGKKLFFDTILSGDKTKSCSSCHNPELAFTDSNRFSEGITGEIGNRNSMPLFNLAWNWDERFNWDGTALGLEEQALEPVENPKEMNNTWENAVSDLQNDTEYPSLFLAAFETNIITKELVVKAIAQFERTLISANSPMDRYLLGDNNAISESAKRGINVFMDEESGDCFHCHGNPNNPLWSDNNFHNNGLDETFTDLGLGKVTGDPNDNGKFKSPSLRNLKYTAPYMHDGRFNTLDEVIEHYSEGLKNSATIDPLMKNVANGGNKLTDQEKADLKEFLNSLNDDNFIQMF